MSIAITVVGHDRPGIIADVTGALAAHGGNIEDSSMSLLRGHFAWTLIVDLDAADEELEATVGPLRRKDLMISVLRLPAEDESNAVETVPFWLTVHGTDRAGIVSAITRVVADFGGNITNLSTRLAGDLYVIGADVDLPADAPLADVAAELTVVGNELGVTAHLRQADADTL